MLSYGSSKFGSPPIVRALSIFVCALFSFMASAIASTNNNRKNMEMQRKRFPGTFEEIQAPKVKDEDDSKLECYERSLMDGKFKSRDPLCFMEG